MLALSRSIVTLSPNTPEGKQYTITCKHHKPEPLRARRHKATKSHPLSPRLSQRQQQQQSPATENKHRMSRLRYTSFSDVADSGRMIPPAVFLTGATFCTRT